MKEIDLQDGERLDDIGFRGLQVIQHQEEFCYGIDAVLLSDFAQLREGAIAIDLGTGTGIIPLILSHKTKARELWGIELQETAYERGVRTITHNGLTDTIHLIKGDIKDAVKLLGGESFDAVITNPPYFVQGGALINGNEAKGASRHETTATLEDFLIAAEGLLRHRGDLYLIHRPSRLVDIFYFSRKLKLEPKKIRFVCPCQGKQPNLVLVHCVKNGGTELKVMNPLFVYRPEGGYTKEVEQIYERQK